MFLFAQSPPESVAIFNEAAKIATQGSVLAVSIAIVWLIFYMVARQVAVFREQGEKSEQKILDITNAHRMQVAEMNAQQKAEMRDMADEHKAEVREIIKDFTDKTSATLMILTSEVKELSFKIREKS